MMARASLLALGAEGSGVLQALQLGRITDDVVTRTSTNLPHLCCSCTGPLVHFISPVVAATVQLGRLVPSTLLF